MPIKEINKVVSEIERLNLGVVSLQDNFISITLSYNNEEIRIDPKYDNQISAIMILKSNHSLITEENLYLLSELFNNCGVNLINVLDFLRIPNNITTELMNEIKGIVETNNFSESTLRSLFRF